MFESLERIEGKAVRRRRRVTRGGDLILDESSEVPSEDVQPICLKVMGLHDLPLERSKCEPLLNVRGGSLILSKRVEPLAG